MSISIPEGTEVFFSWQDYERTQEVHIIIMNNQGIPVFEIPIEHGSSYILKTKGFRKGLYYWKIMMDDDLVLMGKFALINN